MEWTSGRMAACPLHSHPTNHNRVLTKLSSAKLIDIGNSEIGENGMTTKVSARLIGALFSAGFIVYGVGFGLVIPLSEHPTF